MKINIFLAIVLFVSFSISIKAQEESSDDLLDMDLSDLMNVEIVSASKKAESLFDAPLNASVLTAEQIKDAGVTSIMEALRLVPGIIVRETTPGNYDIHIRGFDNADFKGVISSTSNTTTLIMINNRPIYNDYQGKTYWELQQIGIDDIDRIEVVQGPVAAMYGPNAATGVINILTKSSTQHKEGFFANTYSQAGTANTVLVNGAIGYNLKNKFGIKLSANLDKRDRHNIDYYIFSNRNINGDTVYWVEELDSSLLDVQNMVVANPYVPMNQRYSNLNERYPNQALATDRYSFNIQSNYNTEDVNINFMGGYGNSMIQAPYSINNFTPLSTDSSTTHFTHLWGNYKKISFNMDYNGGQTKTLGNMNYDINDYKIINTNIEYDINLFNDKLNIKPGVSYKNSTFNAIMLGSKGIETGTYNLTEGIGDVSNSTISGFVRAEYNLNKFRFIGALRADKFDTPDVAFISPLLIATYKPQDKLLFRASYGRACRNPFMMNIFTNYMYPSELMGGAFKLNVHVKGNPYENLLTVDETEIGFRYNITDRMTLDVGGFYAQMKNMDVLQRYNRIQQITGSGVQIDLYTSYFNIDAVANQTGANISLKAMPIDKLTVIAFATLQQTIINNYPDSLSFNFSADSTEITAVAVDGSDEDNNAYLDDYKHLATPSVYGGLNITYLPLEKLTLNAMGYFYTEHEQSINTNSTNSDKGYEIFKVESNFILNFTAGYEVYKNTKLFVSGHNLLGANKRQFGLSDKIGSYFTIGVNFKY